MSNLAPISVRMSADERLRVEIAAKQERTNLSEFVRRSAVERAELKLLERSAVSIAAEDWEQFEAWAKSPPQDIPEMAALADWRPAWKK